MGKRIVHFEIPVRDAERMSKFYGDLFGWKFDKQNMGGMDYWMIETSGRGETDLAGGMYPKQGETDRPRFYIDVDNIDSHTDMFKQAGGAVVMEKQEVPGFGWSVMGTDPEGNLVGLFQSVRPQRPARTSTTKKRSSKAKKSKKSKKGRK
ncbi:MAG: VOC family protein [Thaumarchaeota archaeon]|nr:VOC family protein [Nitrososphaerota archaeon]